MEALSSSGLLLLWERGQRLHPIDRGLLVSGAAMPGASWDSLADLPLGRRNQALLELRTACFGSRMAAGVACPECGEKLEFELDCNTLAAYGAAEPGRVVMVRGRAYRLPTSRDLALAAQESDLELAELRLLEICRVDPDQVADGPEQDTERDVEEIGEQMASEDPAAETILSLECARCGLHWDEPLDIVDFLWIEIDAHARRLLLEVHGLASAYGWSEGEILSLSGQRRAAYLEMVHA